VCLLSLQAVLVDELEVILYECRSVSDCIHCISLVTVPGEGYFSSLACSPNSFAAAFAVCSDSH
jgi:hypothetical protein